MTHHRSARWSVRPEADQAQPQHLEHPGHRVGDALTALAAAGSPLDVSLTVNGVPARLIVGARPAAAAVAVAVGPAPDLPCPALLDPWHSEDFAYVRWLGDRKEIEKQTMTWDKTIVDRESDLKKWVDLLRDMVMNKKLRKLFAFANNHYAGHGPATVKLFMDLWNDKK